MQLSRKIPSLSLALAWWVATVAAVVDLAFDTTTTYGPDGPWYGIHFEVAYQNEEGTPSATYPINLLPALFGTATGGGPAAWVPLRRMCEIEYPDQGDCGEGGALPTSSSRLISNSTWFSSYNDWLAGYGWNMSGPPTIGALEGSGSFSMPVAIVGIANQSHVQFPNAITVGPELGFFSLGNGYINDNDYPFDNPPVYAFNQSTTDSITWNMHVGAGSLGYPGSLVFGGYDKGRAVGPVLDFTSFNEGLTVGLRDVILGVEVGESPLPVSTQSGLLVPDTLSNGDILPANVAPQFPYIGLPNTTIDAIANYLPIYLDSQSRYWLWNTTHPDYSKIVSSSAYLGFVLSSITGDGTNVTIKVPFPLLNLTLETTASGLESDVAYFPVLETSVPEPGSLATLTLGRAFLQAAYVGSNWGNNASWISQAVGPGSTNEGLGTALVDLSATSTTLGLVADDSAFQSSWSGHWTVYSSKNTPSPSPTGSHSSSSGISSGAIAGIVVGVVALLAIIAAGIFFKRRRSKSRQVTSSSLAGTQDTTEKSQFAVSEMSSPATHRWSEVETNEERKELSATRPVHELPVN